MKSFEKGEVLTADRLNELLAATAGTADTAGRTVPPRPGIKAQPGLARFNMQAVDACTGEVGALPDYAGLIKGVEYASLDAPRIDRGAVRLPLAHDWDPADDSSLPPEQATGGICSINVRDGLKRACIHRGSIQLPLAHSDWDGAEGAMSTPGLVYGVEIHDNCEGAIAAPYIEQGIIHLPAPTGGGGGEDDDCPGTCSCPLAHVEGPDITPGLICGIENSSDDYPGIMNGVIYLPKAHQAQGADTCLGTAGMVRSIDADGDRDGFIIHGEIHAPWALRHVMPENRAGWPTHLLDLEGCDWCPVTMSTCTLPDGTKLYLNAWLQDGGLRLSLTTGSYYSDYYSY